MQLILVGHRDADPLGAQQLQQLRLVGEIGLNAALAVLTAVTVVAAMRVVGLLLVAALLVLPIATARLLARSFRATLMVAVGVGIVAVVVGLGIARVWGLAPGGTIAIADARRVDTSAFWRAMAARRT